MDWTDPNIDSPTWQGNISHMHIEDLRHFLSYQTNMLAYGSAMGQWYQYCPTHCPPQTVNFYGTATASASNNGIALDYSEGMPAPGQDGKHGVPILKNFIASAYGTVTHGEEPSWAQYGNIASYATCRLIYPCIAENAVFIPVQNQSIIIEGLSYTVSRYPEYRGYHPKQATLSFMFISYNNVYKTASWAEFNSLGNPTGITMPSSINIPNTFASLYGRPYQEGDRWYYLVIQVGASNSGFPGGYDTWWSRCTLNCTSIKLVSN